MTQSAQKQKRKIERILEQAGFAGDQITGATDDELLDISGIAGATLKKIRAWWPEENGGAPAVFDFGAEVSSEEAKRNGLWFDMSKIAPERWGPLRLRLRSLNSPVVIARVDKIEKELLAGQPGSEVALGKVREEVKADTGDRALSRAVVNAALSLGIKSLSRAQQIEFNWRRAVAVTRGIRGPAKFPGGEERSFTGEEPEEEIQRLLEPAYRVKLERVADVTQLVDRMADLDDAEICRLGENFVVTERPAAGWRDSVANLLAAGKGR